MFRKFLIVLFLLVTAMMQSQFLPLSEDAKVSIVTIGPGDNLYDKFGHSAFRVEDPNRGFDAIYNYGVFDFETPNFYLKFAQGKLLYNLEGVYTQPFFDQYISQNRWIKQQELNLSFNERQALFSFLNNNLKEENKYYQYDFFYDNCATKIRDVLVSVLGEDLTFTTDFSAENKTFRELIQQNVYWNSWGSLGMDAAIGAVTDKKADSWQYQFLPDYVFQAAVGASIIRDGNETALVKTTDTIFDAPLRTKGSNFFTSPLFVFSLVGFIIIGLTYRDAKRQKRSNMLDAVIFISTGIIGVLLCLLWFATDHSTTVNNYNILWAFPFNLLIAYAIGKKHPKNWVRRYVIFLLLLMVLLTVHWLTGVQEFAYAFIPLFIALVIRYFYIVKALKK